MYYPYYYDFCQERAYYDLYQQGPYGYNPYTRQQRNLTPCIGKVTKIVLTNGRSFELLVESYNPSGNTVGRDTITNAKVTFPSYMIRSATCY